MDKLANHLKFIIKEERKLTILSEPDPKVPQLKHTGILGTLIEHVWLLGSKYFKDKDEFKLSAEKLQRERELQGKGGMNSVHQPFCRPEIEELLNRRIDVISSFDVEVDGKRVPTPR